jgi:hypothetical protein
MPQDLPQLRRRIVEAVAAIDSQMLKRVWQELDYRMLYLSPDDGHDDARNMLRHQ